MGGAIWAINFFAYVYSAKAFNAGLLQAASIAISRNHSYFSPLSLRECYLMVFDVFKVFYILGLDVAIALSYGILCLFGER
jgi:hypothetical protein